MKEIKKRNILIGMIRQQSNEFEKYLNNECIGWCKLRNVLKKNMNEVEGDSRLSNDESQVNLDDNLQKLSKIDREQKDRYI